MITRLNLEPADPGLQVPAADPAVPAHPVPLSGSSSGQIVVGRYLLHAGASCGAVIEEISRQQGGFRRRHIPVLVRPGPVRGMLDRQSEVVAAFSAIDAGLSIEVIGPPGIGKTTLLRQLANHPRADAFGDGVVYLTARNQASSDLRQLLFDAFYECDVICKPTESEIRESLQEIEALILLDDVETPPDEMEQVLEVAPRSAFVLATRRHDRASEARALQLVGLSSEQAVRLLEREVGRPLESADSAVAETICTSLEGDPLRIRQAAALVRDRAISLEELARDVVPHNLLAELTASIGDKERRALLALAALPGLPLPPQHIAGLAEITDIEPSISMLFARGLVVRAQSRYRVADGVRDRLRRTEDLKPWGHRAITYFTAWAERNRRNPETLLDQVEALVRVQQHAVDTKRWGEVLQLGRIVEGALILDARWGAWAVLLQHCLAAARATGDQATEGWALHQNGSRALCLGDRATARTLLNQALPLREAVGDRDAVAATRRNLSFVRAPEPVIVPPQPIATPAAKPVTTPRTLDEGVGFDSMRFREIPSLLVSRDTIRPRTVPHSNATAWLMWPLALMFIAFMATLAYWANPAVLSPASWNLAGLGSVVQSGFTGSSASFSQRLPSAHARTAPRVLRFTAFPDRVAPGEALGLCYDVEDGAQVRIEPGIGDVDPRSQKCVTVRPTETTTYVLTARTPDGGAARQSVEVRVGLEDAVVATTGADRARILIFSPRPGSITTRRSTALCYAVSGAVSARIQPTVGEVDASNELTCVRVAPGETTAYELTAYGRDHVPVRQQVVVVK